MQTSAEIDLRQPNRTRAFIRCARASLLAALGVVFSGAHAHAGSSIIARGVPDDWSHHTVVFSHPGTAPGNPAARSRWSKIVNDTRFKLQAQQFRARREAARELPLPSIASTPLAELSAAKAVVQPKIKRDWSMSMVNAAAGSTALSVARFPAKYSFDSGLTPKCDSDPDPDFVVFQTGSTTAGVADIIAYDNLYKSPTCAGTVPMVYFQYDVTGSVPSSPTISLDGKQLAFVSVNTSNQASLMIVKWAKNASLVALSPIAAASYRSCTAPCMTTIPLTGNPNSTGSSVFYDYNNDAVYVGDNAGTVHKFINVFVSGTPQELTGATAASGWPVPVDIATNGLPSGVFDPVNNQFIIGTNSGYVARVPVNGGTGNVVQSATLVSNCGFQSPPIVDLTTGRAYFVLNDHRTTGTRNTCGSTTGTPRPAVVEYSTTFAAGAAPLATQRFTTGTSRNNTLNSTFPVFDDAYFNSPSSSGALYACVHGPNPRLLRLTITSNLLSALAAGPTIGSATTPTSARPQPTCGPISEFFDGTTDRLFAGVYTGVPTATGTYTCGGGASQVGRGCIMTFDITSPTMTNATTPAAVLQMTGGGPSGISIDNAASGGGAQVYFQSIMPQVCTGNGTVGAATGYCAIQASQAGLL